MNENEISEYVVDAAVEVHRNLGPGLLENAYEAALSFELEQRGLQVNRQVALPLIYKGHDLGLGYRIDLLVNKKVIVELKTVDEIHHMHLAQVLTYLKLSGLKLGFILNFKAELRKLGIKRIVNKL